MTKENDTGHEQRAPMRAYCDFCEDWVSDVYTTTDGEWRVCWECFDDIVRDERIRNALDNALLPPPQANGFPAGWPDGVKAQLAPMHSVTAPTEQAMTADQWAAAHASDTMESIDRGILKATRTINQNRGECCIATALINRILATYDEFERVRQDNHHLREEKAIVWDTIITGSVPPVSNSQPGTRE